MKLNSPPIPMRSSGGNYVFPTVKEPASGSKGVVTSNHVLASHAGVELLLAGGNAVDAAIGTMFALSVVEPMMTTVFGAGFTNIHMADGTDIVIDNYAEVPKAATPDLFEPIPDHLDHGVVDDLNLTGHLAVGVGGTCLGWATAIEKYGNLELYDVVAPAVRLATKGFPVSPYLKQSIINAESGLRRFTDSQKVFLPGDHVPEVGHRIIRSDYANTLERIGSEGPGYLYGGPLGKAIADDMRAHGGLITEEEISDYKIYERPPVIARIGAGYEILAPPPPSSGGTHIVQMMNILESYDLAGTGFGSTEGVHLLSEALKIAFADRTQYMADPLTTDIPIDWLISKEYGQDRANDIDLNRARQYSYGERPAPEHNETTTCCAMDSDGNVVASTNTLHGAFGSKVTVPGTGTLLNNTMQLMDPRPGRTNSIAPGKRILSSMSPVIVLKDGETNFALGSVGGLRIFSSVHQAITNVIVHGMTLQQAVESPRIFDQGHGLEIEASFPDVQNLLSELSNLGHEASAPFKIGGGMNGIYRDLETGLMSGVACWRADGAPVAVGGGEALVEPTETLGVRD